MLGSPTTGKDARNGGSVMDELNELLKRAKDYKMTAEEQEAQRRSFAYGNTRIENDQITRASIKDAAERLDVTNDTEYGK